MGKNPRTADICPKPTEYGAEMPWSETEHTEPPNKAAKPTPSKVPSCRHKSKKDSSDLGDSIWKCRDRNLSCRKHTHTHTLAYVVSRTEPKYSRCYLQSRIMKVQYPTKFSRTCRLTDIWWKDQMAIPQKRERWSSTTNCINLWGCWKNQTASVWSNGRLESSCFSNTTMAV